MKYVSSHARFEAVRAWLRRPVFRLLALGCAISLFIAGAVWSFRVLGISVSDLRPGSLAVLALLVVPSVFYGGFGLVLLARSARLSMPLGSATTLSAYAYLAELLPVPGGAIVRIGALVNAGGGMRRSSMLVLITAVLWIALAMMGAGIALLWSYHSLAWVLLLVGIVCVIGIIVWLGKVAGFAIAFQTLAHRITGIALTGLRLKFAFAALGTSIDFTQTLPFVLAVLLGSASMIAPAGLGVSESIAALIATTGTIAPGIAFLATGMDRLFCIMGCSVTALVDLLSRYRK